MNASMQSEIERYVASHPASRDLQEEASRYLPGGSSRTAAYFDPYPFFVDHGEGHYLFDVDGNRYLDFMLNATSLIMGHAHPEVVEALHAEAAKGVAFSGPTEAQIRLAKTLCDRVPSVETARFTNSGTEATLNSIRAARAFTGRHKIAKFEGGYHGAHEYASISVNPPGDRLDPSGPTAVPEFPGMPPGVLEGVVVLPYNDLEECDRRIREQSDELACVIMEPVASNIGYVPGTLDFLRGIRELTTELGILLVFDEVQSFRLGPGGAQERFGVVPDVTAFGKIVAGGMPAGAFGGREEIMALFDPTGGGAAVPHAGTTNANPMTMVAGEITLRHLTPEVYERLDRLGDTLRSKLRAVFDEFEVDAQVTGIGSLFGVHFTSEEVTDYRSMLRGDPDMKRLFFLGLVNEDVLLQNRSAGALSTLTTESDVDKLVDATRRVVGRVSGEG